MSEAVARESVITCPVCSHRAREVMAENACLIHYRCRGCEAELRPKRGDCCVFCSFGSVPCPPVQVAGRCG